MDDFDRFSGFSSLYAAHLKTRLGKRHKAEVIRFEINLGYNLVQLSKMIRENTYLPVEYYHFQVFEPKQREIHALRYPDRVVQRSLCDKVLMPVIEPRLIFDNAACRRGKGLHFSIRRLSGFLREHYSEHGVKGYSLKCDIHKYFQSINHRVLLTQINALPISEKTRKFVGSLIECYESTNGCGLPLGNQSSQWFALFYLDKLDRMIKENLKIKHYVRYMDDFILLHSDKSVLKDARGQIESMLKESLQLTLNEKTQISSLSCGIKYLGFNFYLTKTGKVIRKLHSSTKKRLDRRIQLLRWEYDNDSITTDDILHVLASYKGHMKHGHCNGLENKLDQMMKPAQIKLV